MVLFDEHEVFKAGDVTGASSTRMCCTVVEAAVGGTFFEVADGGRPRSPLEGLFASVVMRLVASRSADDGRLRVAEAGRNDSSTALDFEGVEPRDSIIS